MNILFAIQGTGNGHLSRARDVYPELCRHGDVEVLVSGIQVDIQVPFPLRHQLYGASFIFGSQGGIDMWATVRKLRPGRFLRDARSIGVKKYDLVVNDFEPLSAWAAKWVGVPCISLSHQYAVLHPRAPTPEKRDWRAIAVLRHYAPCRRGYGFHFKSYGERIFTPVIRREIRALTPTDEGHITVYLPAYNDAILLPHLQHFGEAKWQVFSKHHHGAPEQHGNVFIQKIENEAFIRSMASAAGVLCGAGFEGPAEALYLGKRLMVIPMEGQYEQQCNAAALADLGVPVIRKLHSKYNDQLRLWLTGAMQAVVIDYPDQTAAIVDGLIEDFKQQQRGR